MMQPQIEDAYVPGLVSVVIPTYNQRAFVRETIDSVLAQDYQTIEIIITDDGSMDGTSDVIREYAVHFPDKIVPVLNDTNTGIAANINRGLSKIRGEYVAWLGGDDIMFPQKIAKQVALLQRRKDSVGCCHDAEVFDSDTGKVLGVFSELFNGKRGFKEGGVELWFDSNYFMLPSTVMIRSENMPKNGFDARLNYRNDWLFDVEIFRLGKCVVINEVLGKYRRHSRNVTGNPKARNEGNEEGLIALAIVEARYPELHHLVRKRRIGFLFAASARAYRNGNATSAKQYLKSVIRLGAIIRGPAAFLALTFFGPYIARQTALLPYERSRLFLKLSKYISG